MTFSTLKHTVYITLLSLILIGQVWSNVGAYVAQVILDFGERMELVQLVDSDMDEEEKKEKEEKENRYLSSSVIDVDISLLHLSAFVDRDTYLAIPHLEINTPPPKLL